MRTDSNFMDWFSLVVMAVLAYGLIQLVEKIMSLFGGA